MGLNVATDTVLAKYVCATQTGHYEKFLDTSADSHVNAMHHPNNTAPSASLETGLQELRKNISLRLLRRWFVARRKLSSSKGLRVSGRTSFRTAWPSHVCAHFEPHLYFWMSGCLLPRCPDMLRGQRRFSGS
eukprot:1006642-Amphidinium_carterae.1